MQRTPFTERDPIPSNPFELKVFSKVAYYIEEDYVDRSRVDARAILVSALLALERAIGELHVSVRGDEADVRVGGASKTFSLAVRNLDQVVVRSRDVMTFLADKVPPDVDPRELEYAAIRGMLATLDDAHSILIEPSMYDEMKLSTAGDVGGAGLVLAIRDGMLTVITPLDDSPAAAAKLEAGDKIMRIDGVPTFDMTLEEAVKKLRGSKGSTLTLLIGRKGRVPVEVPIVRDVIRIVNVEGRLLDGSIAYVRVKAFQEDTGSDVRRILESSRMKAGGKLKGIVLDLRNNPGGLLDETTKLAEVFLSNQTVFTMTGAQGLSNQKKARSLPDADTETSLAVLINGGSAAASEIVAAALKDNDRAILIGSRTFGMGSIQNLFDLRDGSALKLTIGKEVRPSGESFESTGVVPDFESIPSRIGLDGVKLTRLLAQKDDERSTVTIRYVDRTQEPLDPEYREIGELNRDFDVLLAAKLVASGSSRRKIMERSSPIVRAALEDQERDLHGMLSRLGIDWRATPVSPIPKMDLEIRSSDGALRAGTEARITATVTNRGPNDIARIHLSTVSEEPLLDGLEFAFGFIKAGEKKSWSVPLPIPPSAASGTSAVRMRLLQDGKDLQTSAPALMTIQGSAAPAFAYMWEVDDARGNGDGLAQAVESFDVVVRATNIGPADASEVIATLKPLGGEVVLDEGRAALGAMPRGATAEARFRMRAKSVDAPIRFQLAIGDPSSSAFARYPIQIPTGSAPLPIGSAQGNRRVTASTGVTIHSGASANATRIARASGGVILSLRARLGDWAQVALPGGRLGWVDGAALVVPAEGPASQKVEWLRMEPPQITAAPRGGSFVAKSSTMSVEGTAASAMGIKDLWITVNGKKEMYRSFTTAMERTTFSHDDLPLRPGRNTITVVVRDGDRRSSTETFHVHRPTE